MKLLYKFFFTFCVTSFTSVGLMLLLVTHNLSTGFNDYVEAEELKHVAALQEQLTLFYDQEKSWESLKQDDALWKSIANFHRKADQSTQEAESEYSLGRLLHVPRRVSLFDANKEVVIGRKEFHSDARNQRILHNGNLVGYLSFIPAQINSYSAENEFLAKQTRNYYTIALAVVILSFVTAWVFSRHLVSPISRLISGTYRMIRGDYQVRVEKQSKDEIAHLAENVNILAQTLEQNQNNRSVWMSDVSHELKTPLTVMRGQLMAIQDGVFQADEKRIQLMVDQVDSLSRIVNDLYQLSITDVGGLSYKKEVVQPVQLLLEVLSGFEAKLDQKPLSVNCSTLTPLLNNERCQILGDSDRLKQLFTNLLENSYRYTHAKGQVNLIAQIEDQDLTLVLQDSAPSVPVEMHNKLFDRFFRVESSRNREHGGSGLGLALCKQITEAHQGIVIASNSPLGGLKVTIRLPLFKEVNL
ncbi:ATP-binding protein [Vibrio sp. 10N.222.54.A1]|uniref:ATP-binding protein n=1 Tax=unclassified Vibrio TaxID=2614977 RepID=UPI0010BD0BC6|nr:ATP-binding protein [Vibrio sp. F13]TKF85236.1 HAMP domain-containing protein [Vibrio sp. F13]